MSRFSASGRWVSRALIGCAVLVILALSLSLNRHSSDEGLALAGAAAHVASSDLGTGSTPHRSCPLSAPSQSLGTCVSGSIAVLESAPESATFAEPKLSHLMAFADSEPTKFHGPRVERPPRF